MIFQYTFIFLYLLLNAFETNGKIFPLNKKADVGKIRQNAPCGSYYGLFFFDNTLFGSTMLSNQVTIADFFFDYSTALNYSASVTITSQSNTSITNNFEIVQPDDFASLNYQIYQVIKQTSGSINVSYYDLVLQTIQFNFVNTSVYSQNPVFILLVNSEIDNLYSTSQLLSNIQIKNQNKIKILGISMDPKYSSQTAMLVNSVDNVYLYNVSDSNKFANINEWILEKACSSPIISRTTTTTTPSPPCNGYVNIVVDGSSYVFTPSQYSKQVKVIENFILPMWNDVTKISTMIMYDQSVIPYIGYNNSQTLDNIKSFIYYYGQSLYTGGLLYEATFSLSTYQPFLTHINEMSSFIFLSNIYDSEINFTKEYVEKLTAHGKVNFIVMGNNINIEVLKYLNISNYFIWDYSDNQISSIQQFFRNNIKCL